MNSQALGFIYSIMCRVCLTENEMKECEANVMRPGDFCDDNMLLAEAFVWAKYANNITNLDTNKDDVNQAWNDAFFFAESNSYFPWKFQRNDTGEICDITAFHKDNGFGVSEWQELAKMELGDTWNNIFRRVDDRCNLLSNIEETAPHNQNGLQLENQSIMSRHP